MRWGLLLFLVPACTLSVDDFDGDGWSVADGDCNDLDPSVNPDASDVHVNDGIDQNCDGHDVVMRDSGLAHECDLFDGGAVYCIGDNSYGQLDVPEHDVAFVEIAAGNNHTCGLDILGGVTCWGDDTYGQSTPPFPYGYVHIGADANYSIGTLGGDAERAVCWGLCRVKAGVKL